MNDISIKAFSLTITCILSFMHFFLFQNCQAHIVSDATQIRRKQVIRQESL